MISCYYHPGRPAIVNLDWLEDGFELCSECLIPRLFELEETLTDQFVGPADITVARVNVGTFAELPCSRCGLAIVNAVPVDDGTFICDDCQELEERTVQIIGEMFTAFHRTVNARMESTREYSPLWHGTNHASAILGDVLTDARATAYAMARGAQPADTGARPEQPCFHHLARPAVVTIDWQSDHARVCADCILPELANLEATYAGDFAQELADGFDMPRPFIRSVRRDRIAAMVARPATNPHPPGDGETVLCFGCGWPVDANDDTASMDDADAPDGFITWHVDCETEDMEQRRLDRQHAEEVRNGEYVGPCDCELHSAPDTVR